MDAPSDQEPISDTVPEPEDDSDDYLPPPRRRRRLSLVTAVLAAAAVGGGFFVGGVQAQKSWGDSSDGQGAGLAALRAAQPTQAQAEAGQGAAGPTEVQGQGVGPGGRLGQATAGTVEAIKDGTIYVTDPTGNTVKVKTTPESRFTKSEQVSLRDVRPGDSVIVQTTEGNDGTLTANAVMVGDLPGLGGQGGGLSVPFGGDQGGGGDFNVPAG